MTREVSTDDQIRGFLFDMLNDLSWDEEWVVSKQECLNWLTKFLSPEGLDEAEIEKAGKDVLRQAHKHNKLFDIPQNIFDDVQLMDIFKAGVYKGVELIRKK